MRTILYLGTRPIPGAFHYPVIRTELLRSTELDLAISRQLECTHLLLTSPNAVQYWHEAGGTFAGICIAIGSATAQALCERGVDCMIADVPTQEGVIALLGKLCLARAFLVYPRSRLARPDLAEYLQKRNVRSLILDLYDTMFQRPEPVPDLANFDEIVFTSPSTVQGFLRIFGKLPQDKQLIAIGPITCRALEQCGSCLNVSLNLSQ